MKKYNFVADKLVRDKAIERLEESGISTTHGKLDGEKLTYYIKKKIDEEAREAFMSDNFDHTLSELCDVYEALKLFLELKKISWDAFQKTADMKKTEKGGYEKGIYLKTLTVPEGHQKLPHYLKESQRYIQIPD
jgi:predicted house-cleaning noncanonical NTP pyrophosphatase (MazG superfamily)